MVYSLRQLAAMVCATACVVAVAQGAPPTAREWYEWLRPEEETRARKRSVNVTKGSKVIGGPKKVAKPSPSKKPEPKKAKPADIKAKPTVIINNRVHGTIRRGDRAWQGKSDDLVKPRSLSQSGVVFQRGSSSTITKHKEPSLGERMLNAFRAMNDRLWRGWPGHKEAKKPAGPTPKVLQKTRIVNDRK